MLADLLRSSRPSSSNPSLQVQRRGLAGTAAIVTGGDSPLARAVALCLAHNGADIVLAYRHEHGGVREAVRRIRNQGAGALALYGELDDPLFGQHVVAATLAQLGHPDAARDASAPGDTFAAQAPRPPAAGSPIADFGDTLRRQLAGHGVLVKAMTRGPIWTPLVPSDPDTELPVNQHQGNTGPCFVFVARDDPARWAAENSRWAHSTS